MDLLFTFVGWLMLLYISINLIGMLVRGLVLVSDIEKQISEGDDTFKKIVSGFYDSKLERKTNFLSLVLIIIYIALLYYFWNIGVVAVALLIMLARYPDLIWEIKYGKENIKKMPAIYSLTLLVTLATFPLLWYVLNYLN